MRRDLTNWRPSGSLFQTFRDLEKEMGRLFDDFSSWDRDLPAGGERREISFTPACDVEESEGAYHYSIDLPGIPKQEVKVEVIDNQLMVSGERREEKKEEGKGRTYRERYYGSFKRILPLPSNIKADQIEAHFDNGVLTISCPKMEASRPKQISIQEGKGGFLNKFGLGKKDKKSIEIDESKKDTAEGRQSSGQ